MVPTDLYTAYTRGSFTASSSDGSFGMCLQPTVGTGTGASAIVTWNSATTSTTTSQVNFLNISAISNVVGEARVVSGGLKVLPNIAETSPPGQIFAGCIPSCSNANTFNSTVGNIISSPAMEMGYANSGASACIYPVDPSSYEFTAATVAGRTNSDGTFWNTSQAMVGGVVPASTQIYYEVILHIEGIQTISSGTVGPLGNNTSNEPSLADYFSNIETVHRIIKDRLPLAGSVNAGAAAPRQSSLATFARGAARTVGTLAGYAGAVLGNPLISMAGTALRGLGG
jgi:hypothetical protein